MISTSLLRQAVRSPTLARSASTAAAASPKPPYKRAYTRTTPSTHRRPAPTPAPTTKPTPASAAAATPVQDAALPIVDAVPEEAVPTPLGHTIDDILDRDPTPQLSPAQASDKAGAAWAGVASDAFPSAPFQQAVAEVDWTTSFHGLSAQAFSKQAAETLMRPLLPGEVEIKPG